MNMTKVENTREQDLHGHAGSQARSSREIAAESERGIASKIRARCATRNRETMKAIRSASSGKESRDLEVFPRILPHDNRLHPVHTDRDRYCTVYRVRLYHQPATTPTPNVTLTTHRVLRFVSFEKFTIILAILRHGLEKDLQTVVITKLEHTGA